MIHLNKTEGLVGLYRGLSASLLRELSSPTPPFDSACTSQFATNSPKLARPTI